MASTSRSSASAWAPRSRKSLGCFTGYRRSCSSLTESLRANSNEAEKARSHAAHGNEEINPVRRSNPHRLVLPEPSAVASGQRDAQPDHRLGFFFSRLTQRQLALRRRGGGVERRRVSSMASTSLRTARWSAGGSSSTRRSRLRSRAVLGE